jgi:hypothetical protein
MSPRCGFVRWTMLREIGESLHLIESAAAQSGFGTEFPSGEDLEIQVPRSLRKRRKAVGMTGSASLSPLGTDIIWTTADPSPRHHEHLLEIEEILPRGVMHYHGLVEAAVRAGFSFTGKRTLREIASVLGRHEMVRTAGKGHLEDQPAYILLTDQRLLIVDIGDPGLAPLLDIPHGSIISITLGKKVTGETLRLALPGSFIDISRLGHGEGHSIANSFREVMKAMSGPPAALTSRGSQPARSQSRR